MSFSTWLAMGGYAEYVWPAYILGIIIFVANLYFPVRDYRRLLNKMKKS